VNRLTDKIEPPTSFKPEDRAFISVITAFALITGLLHIWAALFPTSANRGFHHFAFLSFPVKTFIPVSHAASCHGAAKQASFALYCKGS